MRILNSLPDDAQVRKITKNIFDRDEFNPYNSKLNEMWSNFWEPIANRWEQWISNQLEKWTATPPETETVKTVGDVGLVLVVFLIILLCFIIGRQLRKRLNLFRPPTSSPVPTTDRQSMLRQANAAAATGDYTLACTCLFKAVLAGLRQEGYDIPYNNHSTRWIIFELERLHYPRLSLMEGFCAEFNFLRYYLGTPDKSEWNSFLRQSDYLLRNNEETKDTD